jgi:hypothetical protein
MFDLIYNLVTLGMMVILKFTLAIVLLLRTTTWTMLGRGLLVMFFLFGVAYALPFLRLSGLSIPDWVTQVLRAIAIIDGLVILIALYRYDWPATPTRVQWGDLLHLGGRPRVRGQAEPPRRVEPPPVLQDEP